MRSPNLEQVLRFAQVNPHDSLAWHPDRLIFIDPLGRADKSLLEDAALHLGEQGVDLDKAHQFWLPQHGSLHFYIRDQRLPRFPQGNYKIHLPAYAFEEVEVKMVSPEVIVEVEHIRTHHPDASFDLSRYATPSNCTQIVTEGKRITKTVNMELIGMDFSTVYSSFLVRIPEPEGYKQIQDGFELFHEQKLAPYLKARQQRAHELSKAMNSESLFSHVRAMDEEFIQANREMLHATAKARVIPIAQLNSALARIYQEHTMLANGTPFAHTYKNVSGLGVDADGRILFDLIIPDRPLTTVDLRNARISGYERLPFNEKYQKRIAQALANPPNKNPTYVRKAQALMHLAYQQLVDRDDTSAIRTAATAFEVVVNGFLMQHNIVQEPEINKYGLDHKLGKLFDQAVRACDPEMGTGRNFFYERLRTKLTGYGNDSNNVPTITGVRNIATHQGLFAESFTRRVAGQTAVAAYMDGTYYILGEGWKSNQKIILSSDLPPWMHPDHARELVPLHKPGQMRDQLAQIYHDALDLLHPLERNLVEQRLKGHSWAQK